MRFVFTSVPKSLSLRNTKYFEVLYTSLQWNPKFINNQIFSLKLNNHLTFYSFSLH